MTDETVLAVLGEANQAMGASWRPESRFGTGMQQGAWRVRDAEVAAVLKWHEPGSAVAYNADIPAVVEHIRSAGYPTPAWLASGVTVDGSAWSIQELVEGEPLRELTVANADMFVELVELQRTLTPPTDLIWNTYVRAVIFDEDHPYHQRLATGGPSLRQLVDEAVALAAPYESATLTETEMVHGDLSVANVLAREGRVVAVVDIDAVGRGCATYDLLSPVVNGISWQSDPRAIERLLRYGLDTYGPAPIALAAACLAIENTVWYLDAVPAESEERVARQLGWLRDLRSRAR